MNEKNCKVLAAQIRLETLKVIHSVASAMWAAPWIWLT